MKKNLCIVFAIVVLITFGGVATSAIEASVHTRNSELKIVTNNNGFGDHPFLRLIEQIRSRIGCLRDGGCHNNSNMTEITGILIVYNSTNFKIGTTSLYFGCYYYINTTISPYDFDGDGTIETRLNELLGLVGTSITVEGYIRCHNTRLIVFYINGIQYRDCSPNRSSK